jgi:hypothetical protein
MRIICVLHILRTRKVRIIKTNYFDMLWREEEITRWNKSFFLSTSLSTHRISRIITIKLKQQYLINFIFYAVHLAVHNVNLWKSSVTKTFSLSLRQRQNRGRIMIQFYKVLKPAFVLSLNLYLCFSISFRIYLIEILFRGFLILVALGKGKKAGKM